jgi:hypothetical protein
MNAFQAVPRLLLLAILLLSSTALGQPISDQSAPAFGPVGDMAHPRWDHISIPLGNGKVLVLGGDSKEAELYDPASKTFGLTGSTIANHREGMTATQLGNGKVLIVGGSNAPAVAELYDPTTGLFELTDSLNSVHAYHTATLLADGKVLIAGGQNPVGPMTTAVCEIYDPVAGTFSLTDTLNIHRSGHDAVRLPDGSVLIVGGLKNTSPGIATYLRDCEVFDPLSGSFTVSPSLGQARVGHTATLLDNQKVLVVGGAYYSSAGEIYDIMTKTWSPTGAMAVVRRSYHTATLLPDGRVLVAGGSVESPSRSVEVYSPTTNAFSLADSMGTARSQHSEASLSGGEVLVTGGYTGSGVAKSAELLTAPGTSGVTIDPIPGSYALAQNYPNPFNPTTTIQFSLPEASDVRLSVHDLLGRRVATLVQGRKEAGSHTAKFDAAGCASGLYLYRLEAGGVVLNRSMILVR